MRFGRAELRGRPSHTPEHSIVLYSGPVWRSRIPWPLLTIISAIGSLLSGWVLVVGFCLLGWVGVLEIPFSSALTLGTQGWLLASGADLALAGGRLSIVPLGLSLLLIVISFGLVSLVARQAYVLDLAATERRKWAVRIGVLFGIVYGLLLAIVAGNMVGASQFLPSLAGGLLIGLVSGILGSARVTGWKVSSLVIRLGWPRWWDALPRAILVGVLVVVGSAATAVSGAFVQNRGRMVSLYEALNPDAVGNFLLIVGQLVYLPNLILWWTSWVSGAGVSIGSETFISPVGNQVGIVPSIPILGIVPNSGLEPGKSLLWLVTVALAGVASAVILLLSQMREYAKRGRAVVGPDLTMLTGGLAGVAAALVVCGLAFLAGGDLGTVRLVRLGARFPDLIIMLPTFMGLSGALTGFIWGIVRFWQGRASKVGK